MDRYSFIVSDSHRLLLAGLPGALQEGEGNRRDGAREALERQLPVLVNGQKQKMSVRAVAYRKLGDRAAGGDQKALAFLLTLANELQPPEPAARAIG